MKRIRVVVAYHSLLSSLGTVLGKNLKSFYMCEEVNKMFCPGPMVSFQSARKVSSYLTRVKVYALEEQKAHSNVIKVSVAQCRFLCLNLLTMLIFQNP